MTAALAWPQLSVYGAADAIATVSDHDAAWVRRHLLRGTAQDDGDGDGRRAPPRLVKPLPFVAYPAPAARVPGFAQRSGLLFLGVATATGYSVGEATALLPSASSLLGRLRACTDAARRLAVGANYRNVLAADEHRDEMGGRRAAASKSGNAILAPAMDIDF